jgi:hypothetical protein
VAKKLDALTRVAESFDLELYYFSGTANKYTGCKLNNLSFDCIAGEVATANLSIVCETIEKIEDLSTISRTSHTKGRKLITWDKTNVIFPSGVLTNEQISSFKYTIDNQIKAIKTQKSLLPTDQNEGVQDITGSFSIYNFVLPPGPDVSEPHGLGIEELTFKIDDLTITHKVGFHPSQRNPLTPDTVISTINWTKLDDFGSVAP